MLALRDDAVYVCYDFICLALLDPPSWIFLKHQKIKEEIITESTQNACEIYKYKTRLSVI